MYNAWYILLAICIYMGFLFLLALWVERKSDRGKSFANNPVIYTLSLAVYCTTWTFYGSIGKAVTSGMMFLPIYLGPTLMFILGLTVLRKMIRIKSEFRITSIADFISARYERSEMLAAIATILALIGIAPYLALQLKAIISTFAHISVTGSSGNNWIQDHVGLVTVIAMIMFTNMFGVRRLDPTERHQGIVVAVALESLVKLIAFMIAGIFITYITYDGFGDILAKVSTSKVLKEAAVGSDTYITWTTFMILAMSAILFLPRQFHVTVIENFKERHLKTVMWLFPLYMLLINVFVFPIAMAGLLKGYPATEADTFLLTLPLAAGSRWLSLFVFIGGFSAGSSMIMISAMALSTMITNHLLLPLTNRYRLLLFTRRYILQFRWAAVAAVILIGFWFEKILGGSYMLVNMGMISFAAVLQYAPIILGGIFLKQCNKKGAQLGLIAGSLVWFYTLLLPAFIKSGWLSSSILNFGPWNIPFLRPECLFGIRGLPPLSHAVFWSLLFNIGFLGFGSIVFRQSSEEKNLAERFCDILNVRNKQRSAVAQEAMTVNTSEKMALLRKLLRQFFSVDQTEHLIVSLNEQYSLPEKEAISVLELSTIQNDVEKILSGAVGTAVAHHAIKAAGIFNQHETDQLTAAYSEILSDIKISPDELRRKIHFYKEREQLLQSHSQDLELEITKKEAEILQRKQAEEQIRQMNEELEARVAQRTADLVSTNVQLSESMDFLQKLLSSSISAIFVVDIERNITEINEQFTRITGFSREEIIGHPCTLLNGFECCVRCSLFEESNESLIRYRQCRILAKDSRQITIIKNVDFLKNAAGEITGGVESFVDVTDLIQARLDAEEANRAKSEFLANMSHEIRTPMNGVMGMTELVLDTPLNDEQREYLTLAKQSADSLLNIINDILDFSKIESGKLLLDSLEFDFEDCLLNSLSTLNLRAQQKGLELISHITSDISNKVIGDPGRLRQIIVNLVGNAIKFTEKGHVLIRVSETSRSNNEMTFSLEIVDTGIGIPPSRMESIFSAFEQADSSTTRKYGGTGLGLSIASQLVQQMGGKIDVESEPGKGSRFSFSITLGIGGDRKIETTKYSTSSLKNLPILVVDDNAINRSIMKEILTRWQMRPEMSDSAEDAWAKLDHAVRENRLYSILLLDVCMPETDGFELVRWIRSDSRYSNVIIIMLSSVGNRGDALTCRELDISAYLTKPIKQAVMLLTLLEATEKFESHKPNKLITQHSIREMSTNLSEGICVLLVEDNIINQKVATRILEKAGFQVETALNGSIAVEKFRNGEFNLILMDIQMPEMNGYDATAEIRKIEAGTGIHIPIIAMTANAMKGDEEKCLAAGMDGYLAKPINSKELLSKIMEFSILNPTEIQ